MLIIFSHRKKKSDYLRNKISEKNRKLCLKFSCEHEKSFSLKNSFTELTNRLKSKVFSDLKIKLNQKFF